MNFFRSDSNSQRIIPSTMAQYIARVCPCICRCCCCLSIYSVNPSRQTGNHPSIHQNRYVSSLRFLFGKNKQTQAGPSKASKRNVTTNWNSIRGRFYYENYQHLQCFPSKQRQLQQADRHSRVHRFTQAQKEAYTALLCSFSSFCWDSTVFFFANKKSFTWRMDRGRHGIPVA